MDFENPELKKKKVSRISLGLLGRGERVNRYGQCQIFTGQPPEASKSWPCVNRRCPEALHGQACASVDRSRPIFCK